MTYDETATHLWSSQDERDSRLRDETVATYDFRIYDETDDGEFMTGAKVDLIERGKVVHTETFSASSEDAPGPGFSAYGNGRDNNAGTLARSYAWSWIDARESSFEERFEPFGVEFEREMEASAR